MNSMSCSSGPAVRRGDWTGRVAAVLMALCTGAVSPGELFAQEGAASTLNRPLPRGLRAEAVYTGEIMGPASGGREQEPVYLDNLDLALELDLEDLIGVPTAVVRAHVQSNRGDSPSSRVGDFQVASNIEAPSGWRLYELWAEVNPVPRRVSLLAGVYDVNAEFDVIPSAALFLNSSFGIGADYATAGLSGPPTFPLTSLGARIRARPTCCVYAALSVMDGAPGHPAHPSRSRFALAGDEGALLSWEIGHTRPEEPLTRPSEVALRVGRRRATGHLETKLAAGGWLFTRGAATYGSGGSTEKSWGVYGLAQQQVLEEPDDRGRLSVFGRLGVTNDEVERIGVYAGGGAVYTGVVPGRPGDAAGLGVAHARNGSPFLRSRRTTGARVERAETVVELTYRLRLSDRLSFQPDLQWIVDPGMAPDVDDALVVGLRGSAGLTLP